MMLDTLFSIIEVKELTAQEKCVLIGIYKLQVKTKSPTNKEVGDEIGVSFQTVAHHVGSLAKKGYITKKKYMSPREGKTHITKRDIEIIFDKIYAQ